MTRPNPVEDTAFTRPLVRALQGHVEAVAESMAGERGARSLDAAQPAAVAWVYMTVLVAWAEDHGLVDPWLRDDAAIRRKQFLALSGQSMSAWLARAIASLCCHPATWCLLDPRYTPLRQAAPSEQVTRQLVEWWSNDAPSLTYKAEQGPLPITGWLPGDLLQALSVDRRKRHALAQTPWWVVDFILDGTLVPAADQFRDTTLRTIDPTCGTGHFLIRKIDYLYELYTTGTLRCRQMTSRAPVAGWTPASPVEAIRRIVEGVAGCEIDPLTAAVARLRFVVAIGDLLHRAGLIAGPLRLDAIPPWVRPRIVVGDSLLAGKVSAEEYARVHPDLAAIVNLGVQGELPEQTTRPAQGVLPL